MPLDPSIAENLTNMVNVINVKEQALADATDANTTAQAASQSAITAAAVALQAQTSSRVGLTDSISVLKAYLETL